MAPIFSKEGILMGAIDHLCLVCEEHLLSDRDLAAHVASTSHADRLEATHYVEKYIDDRIRKIQKWYFCEFFSVLLSTMSKVALHVEEAKHCDLRKSSLLIERLRSVVMIFGNLAINEEAWHGVIENTCTLCNVEFKDKNKHINLTTHIIKLIQSNVGNFGGNVYRKLDDIFHCLTCNKIVADIAVHFKESKHTELLHKCCKVVLSRNKSSFKQCAQESISKKKNEEESKDIVKANSTLTDPINILQNKNIVNDKTSTEGKIECKIKFNEDICKALKVENCIVRDLVGNLKCILCDCSVEPLEAKSHCDDTHHQALLQMHKERGEKLTKTENDANDIEKPASDILDSIEKFQNYSIDINFETSKAVCNRCKVTLNFSSKSIESHIEQHEKEANEKKGVERKPPLLMEEDKKKMPKTSEILFASPSSMNSDTKENVEPKPRVHRKDIDEGIEGFAHKNGLVYISKDKKVLCLQCNRYVPPTVKNINEHLEGAAHKYNAENLKDVTSKTIEIISHFPCVRTYDFITSIVAVEHDIYQDVIVNGTICINFLSLILTTIINRRKYKCNLCGKKVISDNIRQHIHDDCHQNLINETLVVVLDTEFIREIRPKVYHCGFCNVIKSSYEMDCHLQSLSHRESKAFSSWRLTEYMPNVEQIPAEQLLHAEAIKNIFL